MSPSHLKPVRDALANPIEPDYDDMPPDDRFGGDYDSAARPPRAMPDDCPVRPVGTEDGTFYFLTALGELRGLTPDKVANKHIVAMFAPESQYLWDTWPRIRMVAEKGPDGKPLKDEDDNPIIKRVVTGWDNEFVPALLMDVGAAKGVWNSREKVRGRGAWKADDGSLILHCGNTVLMGGVWRNPDMYEKMVYPTAPPTPKPAPAAGAGATADQIAPLLAGELRSRGIPIAADASSAQLLLELLKTWNWARPFVDPQLLLGWIGAAMVGGALDYRPIAWITADAAAGKSALQKLMGWLFENGILQSPEASEAGVRQTLGQQSLPVGLDEAEATSDNRKLLALVTLARVAATSQGAIIRGGQDHKATDFRANSCFLFSSVLVPPLTPADKSRLALLELGALAKGSRSPVRDEHKREIHAIGAWLRRRFVDRWREWPEIFEAYHDALLSYGEQSSRAADQFGTLAAASHLLLTDGLPDEEELSMIGMKFGKGELSETNEETQEGPICLDELMSKQVQLDRGGATKSVAEWVARAAKAPRPNMMQDMIDEMAADRRLANEALARIGLSVVELYPKTPGELMLAIAGAHEGLARLFEGSKYRGIWSQALGRLPGAVRDANRRLDHRQKKCTLVPIALAIELGDADGVAVGVSGMVDA